MKIDGGCHCGSITYRAEIDPDEVALCHCTDCQTLSGSAFRTIVYAEEDTFQLLSGEPRIYVRMAESGARRAQAFCAECGTPLYSTAADGGAKSVCLRVGTVRQRAELRPATQYWCRSAQGWVMDLRSVKQLEKQ